MTDPEILFLEIDYRQFVTEEKPLVNLETLAEAVGEICLRVTEGGEAEPFVVMVFSDD